MFINYTMKICHRLVFVVFARSCQNIPAKRKYSLCDAEKVHTKSKVSTLRKVIFSSALVRMYVSVLFGFWTWECENSTRNFLSTV